MEESVAEKLVGEGFLSYDDLSVIEPADLMEMGGLSEEAVDAIVAEAERRAAVAEMAAADERRKQREQERVEKAATDGPPADVTAMVEADSPAGDGEPAAGAADGADGPGASGVDSTMMPGADRGQ